MTDPIKMTDTLPPPEPIKMAIEALKRNMVGLLPREGWLRDNDESRAALADLFKAADALAAMQQQPVVRPAEQTDAYETIDRYLRNSLDDEAYAKYSAALDVVFLAAAQPAQPEAEQVERVTIDGWDDFTDACEHCLLSSEQDQRHQAKALLEFAIPALEWAYVNTQKLNTRLFVNHFNAKTAPAAASPEQSAEPHAELRKTYAAGQRWQWSAGGKHQWQNQIKNGVWIEPNWVPGVNYRRHPADQEAARPALSGDLTDKQIIAGYHAFVAKDGEFDYGCGHAQATINASCCEAFRQAVRGDTQ